MVDYSGLVGTSSKKEKEKPEEMGLAERLLGLLPKVAMNVATSGISDALGSFFEPVAGEVLGEVTGGLTSAAGLTDVAPSPETVVRQYRGREPVAKRPTPFESVPESDVTQAMAQSEVASRAQADAQRVPILERIRSEPVPQIGMAGRETFSEGGAGSGSSFMERMPGRVGREGLTAGGEELRKELAQRERLFSASEPTASIRPGWTPGPGWDPDAPSRGAVERAPAPEVVERAPAPRRRRRERPVEVPGFDPAAGARVASPGETERLFGGDTMAARGMTWFDPVGGSRVASPGETERLFPQAPPELTVPINERPPPIIAETGTSGDAYRALQQLGESRLPVPEPTYPDGGYIDLQQAILIKASQDEAERQRRLAEQIGRGVVSPTFVFGR